MSIAFSAVVALWVIVIVVSSLLVAQSGIRETIIMQEYQSPNGLVDSLQDYYKEHNGWDGLDTALIGRSEEFAIGPRLGLILVITDEANQILYNSSPNTIIDFSALASWSSVPLRIDDETRGYIHLGTPPNQLKLRPDQTRFVLEGLSTALLVMGVTGGVIGLIFGIFVSRSLTAPLRRLSDAARAIGAQNLSRRVKVEGTVEVKDMANAFNEMAAALEQTETLRRNLVADVAHELRTPLTVLQGNLLAILDEVYPMNNIEVARLYDQTRLLSRLVEDLHELSQADANQLKLDLQPVQVDDLVNTTVAKFAPLAEAEGVVLNIDMAPNLPLLMADSGRLSQVLHNLLNNALVHTLKGGEITIRTSYDTSKLQLSVKDTGEGIASENLPYIFNRFYRADPSRNRNTGGTGLGLAIVKAIIEMHGGHITVMSEGKSGKGSTFTIEFPIQLTRGLNLAHG